MKVQFPSKNTIWSFNKCYLFLLPSLSTYKEKSFSSLLSNLTRVGQRPWWIGSQETKKKSTRKLSLLSSPINLLLQRVRQAPCLQENVTLEGADTAIHLRLSEDRDIEDRDTEDRDTEVSRWSGSRGSEAGRQRCEWKLAVFRLIG